MRPSRSLLFTAPVFAALTCLAACALEPEPEAADEADDGTPAGGEESRLEPGCGPRPNHWCEGFLVHAEYPEPGAYGTENGYAGCINRADADLETTCIQNGGLGQGCCGGNAPDPFNHSHPSADWSAGMWHCTGRMDLWRQCTAGSTNEECQPVCD